MAAACECHDPHLHRRVVLTGGPGAGKTAVLELIRQHFCTHVHVLRESAGIVFGGGFPRATDGEALKAAQRAIFYVQRELEAAAEAENPAIVLCDRGTVDGAAYWPGDEELWNAVRTTLREQLARYDAVIHLRTPAAYAGYNHGNPLRIESAVDAMLIDERLLDVWRDHPRRFVIDADPDFLAKAKRVLDVVRGELPACCQQHTVPELDRPAS